MKRTGNKVLSLILTLCMVLSLLPVGAGATAAELSLGNAIKTGVAYNFKLNNVTVGVNDITALQINVTGGTVTGTATGWATLENIGNTNVTLYPTDKAAKSGTDVKTALEELSFTASSNMTINVKITTKATSITAGGDRKLTAGTGSLAGHYYMYVPSENTSWKYAYGQAKENIFMGMKGYLATITSQAEDELLTKISEKGAWSGGAALTGNSDDGPNAPTNFGGGDFQWTCGPEANGTGADTIYYNSRWYKGSAVENRYNNWYRPSKETEYEPNNGKGDTKPEDDWNKQEPCMQVNFGDGKTKAWNDVPEPGTAGSSSIRYTTGYFVEFGGYADGKDPGASAGGGSGSTGADYSASLTVTLANVGASKIEKPTVDEKGNGQVVVTEDASKEYKIAPNTGVDAFDKKGDKLTPDGDGWVTTTNGPITFKPLTPGVDYTVSTRPKENSDAATGGSGVDERITIPAIGGNVHAVTDPLDNTKIQIVIDPADAGLDYGILNEDGSALVSPNDAWKSLVNGKVTFGGLDPNIKYQIVSRTKDDSSKPTPTGEKGKGTTITTPAAEICTGVAADKVDRLPGTPAGKDKIVINPTDAGKDYGITDPVTGATTWKTGTGGELTFDGLEPGKDYKVTIRKSPDGIPGAGVSVPKNISTTNITGGYDDKGTSDAADDTATITVTSPDTSLDYGIVDVSTGNAVGTWKPGVEGGVKFDNLTPGTDYKVVTRPKADAAAKPAVNEIPGGTGIVTPVPPVDPSKVDRLPGTPAGKDKIVIKGTVNTKDYGITDPVTGVTTWKTGNGGELTFDGLEPGKDYKVSIRKNSDGIPGAGVSVPKNISTTNITGGYDDKGTPGTEGDTATITVTSPDTSLDYGIVDGTGALVAAPNNVWKPGTGTVKFEGLTPGGNYKVVTRPTAEVSAKPAVNEIPGGTGIVTPVPPVDPSAVTREVDSGHVGMDKITITTTVNTQTYTVTDLTDGTSTTKDGTGSALVFNPLDPTHKYQVTTAKKDDKGTTKLPSLPAVVDVRGKVTLTGVVKDSGGAAVANATVKVAVKTIDGGSRVLTAVTDAGGSYTFTETDVENGSYDVYVDGGAKGSVTAVAVVNGGTLNSGNLTLDATKKNILGGVVTTVDGKPVKTAAVEVFDKSTGLAVAPHADSITTTKDGGGYVIENLVDGTYIIQTTDGTKSGMTEIVVKDGKILPNTEGGFKNTDISTVPGSIVTGNITGLGVGEKAKVTITVPIVDETGAVIGTKNITAQAVGIGGHYQFAGVPDGDYPATVVGPDGRLIVDKITITGGVVTGGDITIPTTKPDKPNVVTGIVMDKNGKPVPGATVKIYDKTGALVTPTKPAIVTTGKGGGWAVEGLDPNAGPFTVTVDKNGTNGVAGPVTVDVSGKVTGKTNVELPGTITGDTVTPDVAGKLLTGKVTGSGKDGATIVVKDSNGKIVGETKTNSDGIYFLPNVPAGATVTVTDKSGNSAGGTVSATGDHLTVTPDLALVAPGENALVVIGPKGDVLPVQKTTETDKIAKVSVKGPKPGTADADAKFNITDGKLVVNGATDGIYTVTVEQNGMKIEKDITIAGGVITGERTMTATSKTVEGKLDYGSGAIPADATVTIKSGDGYIWGSAMVNPKDGSYKITGIPEGSYTVEVAVKNPKDDTKNATITNTVTVTKDGTVTFGPDWTADKGADITTGTGGKLTVTPSAAVKTVTDAITAALDETNAADVKMVVDTVKALTEEEQKQIKTDEVKKLSDKLVTLLAKLTVAADANGVTTATKEATKGVLNDQKGLLVTGEEVTAAVSKTVKVGLALDANNVTANPPADRNKAEAAAKGGDIGAFFDISVTKTTEVTSSDGAKSTATEKVPVLPVAVPVTLAIPAEIQGHAYYNVIRVHNGVAERIPATATETTISFTSNLYSTYAIAYSDDPIFTDDKPAVKDPVAPPDPGVDTSGGNSSNHSNKVSADPTVNGVATLLNTKDHNAYLIGRPDGSFGGTASMTRGEVAVMFARLLKQQDSAPAAGFTDVAPDAWYAAAVNQLTALGMMKGRGEGVFAPEDFVTRAEFVVIASRFAKTAPGSKTYSDVAADHWASAAIGSASAYGWIDGYEDGSFKPQGNITRSEVVKVVNAMLGRSGDKAFIAAATGLKTFPDVAKDNWAFYEIAEATNTHNYKKANNAAETWSK